MSIFTKIPSDKDKKKASSLSALIVLILFGGFLYYLFGGGIEEQAAGDAIDQYNIVAEDNDFMQMCLRAGVVAEVYLQANNQTEYRKWKEIKKNDCASAGLPG